LLQNRKEDWLRALVIAAVVTVAAFSMQSVGEKVDIHITRRIEYRLREFFGLAPKLHPRIKVLAFEDRSVQALQVSDLPIAQWGELLARIADAKPSAIFVDKIFGILHEPEGSKQFLEKLHTTSVPIITGSYIKEEKIGTPPDYTTNLAQIPIQNLGSSPRWLPMRQGQVFGPNENVMPELDRIGHLEYVGNGLYQPILKTVNGVVLPHVGLYVASNIRLTDHGVQTDRGHLDLDAEGRAFVNFSERRHYLERAVPLIEVMRNTTHLNNWVQEGDIVILLPAMFTGNSDMKETQIGKIPGGFILASIINSILTGNHFKSLPFATLLIPTASVLGAALAVLLSAFAAIFGGIFVALAVAGFGIWAFCHAGIVVPWVWTDLAFLFATSATALDKIRRFEAKSRRLRYALEGMIAPGKIELLMKAPESLRLEASEQVITLLFVDIIDFAKFAERRSPKAVFAALRSLMSKLSDTIIAHGGVVDKSLGDGLLCYFGYNYGQFDALPPDQVNKRLTKSHADQAIACAAAIQRLHLEHCLTANPDSEIIHPLRIGVNSAGVYIGDLGTSSKIEVTVIGHGVNYAQRCESACDPYKVMIGQTTRDLAHNVGEHGPLVERHISIKNQAQTFVAFELNPLHEVGPKIGEAVARFRKTLGIERKDQRWPIEPHDLVLAKTEFGDGLMVDFSAEGFALALPRYLAKGVTFPVHFETKYGDVIDVGGDLIVQVRWGRPRADGQFVHGVLIQNARQSRRVKVVETLRQLLRDQSLFRQAS
jgi:class 3 adenylate cyclase/CHASE2 domain-containing sensor protein